MSVDRRFGIKTILMVSLLTAIGAAGAVAQTPVVQWTFDEAAGGTVDAVDTGAPPATTGVLGSTATRTTDTPGGGPGFSVDLTAPGPTSIVDGGNPIEVDTLAQFTLSTWVKVTSPTDYNEGGSGNVRLLAKQSGGLFDGFSWNMNAPRAPNVRSNNAFTTGLFVGGESAFAFSLAQMADGTPVDILDRGGEWFFLAVTYDGNAAVDNAKFYIGDELTPVMQLGDTVTIDAGPVFSTNTSNGGVADARFTVGLTDAAPMADTALTGYQDDVRVYDSVLDLEALGMVRLANLPEDVGLTGDYNDNGAVDAADYTVWRDTLGQTGEGLAADGSVNDLVDDDDYVVWKTNFGVTAVSSSGADAHAIVPEPTSLALLIVGMVATIVALRRAAVS